MYDKVGCRPLWPPFSNMYVCWYSTESVQLDSISSVCVDLRQWRLISVVTDPVMRFS